MKCKGSWVGVALPARSSQQAQQGSIGNHCHSSVVDRASNITVIARCYYASLYLSGEPWLHERAVPDILSYLCTYCNQSVLHIKTLCLCDNPLEDYCTIILVFRSLVDVS